MRAAAMLGVLVALACTRQQSVDTDRKTLNTTLLSDVKSFDPGMINDSYSHVAVDQVFEGLLQYHYLKRPYTVAPLTVENLPEISKDGRTYTFRLRDNVFFHDDPAFGGRPRKLTAADYVYSFKRLADPKLNSPNWWLFENHIEGLDAFRKKLAESKGPVNYDSIPVSGFSAPNERTLVLKLTRPYRQLLFVLTMAPAAAVAREVVEKYGDEFLNHPVGTGPFVLKEWRRGQRLIFTRNSKYWGDRYPSEGMPDDGTAGLLRPAGQTVPFVDELNMWVYVESQPRWLNLLQGNLDFADIPKESYDSVYDEKKQLKPDIARRKMQVNWVEGADLVFFVLNMEDPVVGKNKYLRQAISAAINRTEKIKLFYNNRAIEAVGPIPPSIFGYDPNLKNPYGYNLDLAKRLMVKAREQYRASGGKGDIPVIKYDTMSDTTHRQLSEAIANDFAQIGLKIEVRPATWPQFQDRKNKKQIQFASYAWNADYPDPENFLQLFYSKNEAPGPNSANFKNPQYDKWYEQIRDMEDGPERLQIIRQMVKMVQEEVPTIFFNHRILYSLLHSWVRNYKRNTMSEGLYKYIDIDLEEKKATLPLLK